MSDVKIPEWLGHQVRAPKGKEGTWTAYYFPARPFNKGLPRRWLSLLIPLMGGETTTKVVMLQSAGFDTRNIETRGYLSTYFSQFVQLDILKFDNVYKVWSQGGRYKEYMAYVFTLSMEIETFRTRFARAMRLGQNTSSSVNFIQDLSEEVEEDDAARASGSTKQKQ